MRRVVRAGLTHETIHRLRGHGVAGVPAGMPRQAARNRAAVDVLRLPFRAAPENERGGSNHVMTPRDMVGTHALRRKTAALWQAAGQGEQAVDCCEAVPAMVKLSRAELYPSS